MNFLSECWDKQMESFNPRAPLIKCILSLYCTNIDVYFN